MNTIIKKILLISLLIFLQSVAFSQIDKTIQLCGQHLVAPFVSDGQEYRAMLNGDEIAEFNTTLYGGSTYRIIACSGTAEGNLIFSLYDKERNLLFTNKDHKNTPYWDFKIKSTVNLLIEAELNKVANNSGFAFIQIGFKQ